MRTMLSYGAAYSARCGQFQDCLQFVKACIMRHLILKAIIRGGNTLSCIRRKKTLVVSEKLVQL